MRHIDASDAAELMGLAALVWVAAEEPSTVSDLAAEVGADRSVASEAVDLLVSSGWLVEASS